MDTLFRVPRATRRDPAVEAWLSERDAGFGAIAREWVRRMRECGDDVRVLMHDGCPVACVTDVAFAYVNVFKAHVNVGFFLGSELHDPAGLLQGTGRRMRHVKVRPGENFDSAALVALTEAAYGNVKRRLASE